MRRRTNEEMKEMLNEQLGLCNYFEKILSKEDLKKIDRMCFLEYEITKEEFYN